MGEGFCESGYVIASIRPRFNSGGPTPAAWRGPALTGR
jgi:hypothetical protein